MVMKAFKGKTMKAVAMAMKSMKLGKLGKGKLAMKIAQRAIKGTIEVDGVKMSPKELTWGSPKLSNKAYKK